MEEPVIQQVDAGVVWIKAGVVMQIHTGKYSTPIHYLYHLSHHATLWRLFRLTAGPDSVVIRLAIQMPKANGSCTDITYKYTQRPR
jgi:hypothetical protein